MKAHVPNVNPTRPNERDRIQELIYDYFGRQLVVHGHCDKAYVMRRDDDSESRLARWPEAVADEKVEMIHRLRPSIQQLGKARLKRLILDVFENTVTEELSDRAIAERYELTPPTFSRFAGRDKGRDGPTGDLADLWANAAAVLSTQPEFCEAAREAGFGWLVDKSRKE